MELGEDLSVATLRELLPEREFRTYPALLSTEADALAWARSGAPAGAVVVADYQASPRGRSGFPWRVRAGRDLAFSIVLRPALSAEREGWMYSVTASALADALGAGALLEWPDGVYRDEERIGSVGVHAELGPERVAWAVVSVVVADAAPARAALLAEVVRCIEARERNDPEKLLEDYRARCRTIGRRVRARLIPLGPGGPEVTGRADGLNDDGSIVIETTRGTRVAVRPQNLGLLEDPAPEPDPNGGSAPWG